MVVDESVIRILMRVGLTEYEARIYATLVKMGQRNATELGFFSGVPRFKTYGSIRSLEKKGFLKIIPGKPERYTAASPNEVLLPLVEALTKDAEKCTKVLETLALSYEASKCIYTEKPFETHDIWTIKGRGRINERIREMTGRAEDSIYVTTTANGLIRIFKAFSDAFEDASRKGVDVRIIAPITGGNETAVRELEEVVKIRCTDLILPRYTCVDSREILFTEALPDDINVKDGQDIATWTNDPHLTKIHSQLFLELWAKLPTTK